MSLRRDASAFFMAPSFHKWEGYVKPHGGLTGVWRLRYKDARKDCGAQMGVTDGWRMRIYEDRYRNRFWSKVRVAGEDECWEWQASRSDGRYGQMGLRTRPVRAHVAAWMLLHGPIPNGLFVCHRCDNPPCCNSLRHMFLGTNADNLLDFKIKNARALLVDAKAQRLAAEREQRRRDPLVRLLTDIGLRARGIEPLEFRSVREIGKRLGISTWRVSDLLNGRVAEIAELNVGAGQ